MKTYEETWKESIESPESFWAKAAENLAWFKPYQQVLDSSNPPFYRWFTGGQINTCYNALDRHVAQGRGTQVAIIYDSPVTQTVKKYTYSDLLEQVSLFGGALKARGVEKGDRVIIYMPMVPEAVIAMLACARLGAIHSVVFGGFAPNELATRIDDAMPKVVVTASCGIEGKKILPYKPLLDKAWEIAAHKPESCILLQRPQVRAEMIPDRDYDWETSLSEASPTDCVPVESTDPLYILYTSGTTGTPKGVVRDNGGHAVALNWTMKNIYNMEPGDVFWAASDVGWVVGHSYIVYGPLLYGATTLVYEGKPVGTPDPGAFWRVVSDHNVKALFTAPTAFRAIKKEDPNGDYLKNHNIDCLKTLFLAGERLDSDTYHWAKDLLGVPVVDHWWQTETGWSIAANCMGIEALPTKPGSPTKPAPGYDVRILDDKELPAGQEGMVAVKLPLPPGCFTTLWRNDERFVRSYMTIYPGYYFTGDGGYMDEDGYLYIMGRVDDVINVAGHRLSTGGMEEVVAMHHDVAECAVVGRADALKGQTPVGFLVLKAGSTIEPDTLRAEVVKMVRESIGAVACFKEAHIVSRLPKTRSGKVLRAIVRKIADGEKYQMPSTIDDPSVLGEFESIFEKNSGTA